MLRNCGATIAAFAITTLWTSETFAGCFFTDCNAGGGVVTPPVTPPVAPPAHAPEIDGPGAFAAIALLLSLGVILYRRVRG